MSKLPGEQEQCKKPLDDRLRTHSERGRRGRDHMGQPQVYDSRLERDALGYRGPPRKSSNPSDTELREMTSTDETPCEKPLDDQRGKPPPFQREPWYGRRGWDHMGQPLVYDSRLERDALGYRGPPRKSSNPSDTELDEINTTKEDPTPDGQADQVHSEEPLDDQVTSAISTTEEASVEKAHNDEFSEKKVQTEEACNKQVSFQEVAAERVTVDVEQDKQDSIDQVTAKEVATEIEPTDKEIIAEVLSKEVSFEGNVFNEIAAEVDSTEDVRVEKLEHVENQAEKVSTHADIVEPIVD